TRFLVMGTPVRSAARPQTAPARLRIVAPLVPRETVGERLVAVATQADWACRSARWAIMILCRLRPAAAGREGAAPQGVEVHAPVAAAAQALVPGRPVPQAAAARMPQQPRWPARRSSSPVSIPIRSS